MYIYVFSIKFYCFYVHKRPNGFVNFSVQLALMKHKYEEVARRYEEIIAEDSIYSEVDVEVSVVTNETQIRGSGASL